jgi:peptide deformylase
MRYAVIVAVFATACVTTSQATRPGGPMENPIVQVGHPVLRERAKDVTREQLATPEFQALLGRMTEAMRQAPGVGLAAPQLGVPLRVFVLEDRAELQVTLTPAELAERERVPVPLRVIINPVLTPVGNERATFFEGCLSVSGYAALVERWREVEVSGLDEKGEPVTWRVRGWPARILQHETDHLDGVIYIDRMLPRTFGTLPQVKARFAGKPIADIKRDLGVP